MNSPSVGVHAGCPGSRMQRIQHSQESAPSVPMQAESQLREWPCQIKLVPVGAPYFEGAKLLIAADCSGNREQIEDGEDGILCQLTPQAVSEAIRWMISHPQKRSEFGKKAQEKAARQTQGIEKFQADYKAVFGE